MLGGNLRRLAVRPRTAKGAISTHGGRMAAPIRTFQQGLKLQRGSLSIGRRQSAKGARESPIGRKPRVRPTGFVAWTPAFFAFG